MTYKPLRSATGPKLVAAFAVVGLLASGIAAAGKRSLPGESVRRLVTVTDCIEAARVVNDFGSDPVLISPRADKYLFVLERGDVKRNGSWIELLAGSTRTLEAASRVELVARLFTRSTASDLIKNVRWLSDDEHVTFLWDPGGDLPQVFEADVLTHHLEQRTHHPTKIALYDISQDGKTVIFISEASHDRSAASTLEQNGFAVTDQSIFSIIQGDVDGWTPWEHYETFVLSASEAQPRRVLEPTNRWLGPPELLRLSPDGRFAVMVRPAVTVPLDWDKYTEHVFKDIYLRGARQDPGGLNDVRQYFVVDTKHASARPLWSAPENPRGVVVWSPNGNAFAIGPTFLPTAVAQEAGLSGRAVAEVDAATGRFIEIPLQQPIPELGYRPIRWDDDETLEVSGALSSETNGGRRIFEKIERSWQPVQDRLVPKPSSTRIQIELRQDPNTPPALYAVESASRNEELILDINPELRKRVSLAHVEPVHWKGTDGVPWSGMLYYPLHFEWGRRFPLVIQTHGYSTTKFSIDGPFTTVFAAQPLANHDIAVLQMGGPDTMGEIIGGTPREPQVFAAGFEGAIQQLSSKWVVDPDKVGLIGFSRTGWLVEYMLTHSQMPVAAAEVADNMDASYFQYVLAQGFRAEDEADNGARPFGKGLETWLQMAPGFNADKVHTPLRMEIDGRPIAAILGLWEMFSNLRYLGKPVELSVVPDINHGTHILQNPRQRLASQGETVDWFCFWLRNEEDSSPAKGGKYARWRDLRRLHKLDMSASQIPQ